MIPVVLVHGATSGPATWDHLRAELTRRGVESRAVTLLAHGEEPRPGSYPLHAFRDHLLADLDALGWDRIVLVGHSLGALTCSLAAQARPELVARLVLEEPPVPPRTPLDAPPMSPVQQARLVASSPFVRGSMDPRALREVVSQFVEPRPQWWERLALLDMPTLVVAGGKDSYLRQERIAALARHLPDASLVTIDGGHRVHSNRPEAYAEAVVPFVVDGVLPAAGRDAR